MILQGESYEFGTVFQTDFVACWMLLVGSLLVGSLLVGNNGNQPNNKITKQQDNKKTRIATFILDGAFIAQE